MKSDKQDKKWAAPVMVVAHSFGRGRVKATDAQILAAYAAAKSVWRAAEILGMCGQSVHERLQKLGAATPINVFTAADDALLILTYTAYSKAGKLQELADRMGRTRQFLARQAKRLGLTDRKIKRPYIAEGTSKRFKKWHQDNPHPRGMFGKFHSEETKNRISDASSARWHGLPEEQKNLVSDRMVSRWKIMTPEEKIALVEKQKVSWKQGWRVVGGVRKFYRSRWEANYARYLEWLRQRGEIDSWQHEPETFWFEEIRRGTRSYLPDFKVVQRGFVTYHEIKGWMDQRSKTKLARMEKYHPSVEMVVVQKKEYQAIAKVVSRIIPDWET